MTLISGIRRKGVSGDKVVEGILAYFQDKEKRDEFFDFYREIETLYEIISPDEFLRPYIDDYAALSKIYELLVNAKSIRPVQDLMKKTEALVRETVSMEGLESTLKLYKIDEETLRAIRSEGESDNTEVVNLARSLVATTDAEIDQKPFLISITERASAILESYDSRQTGTREALTALEKLVEEYNQASKEMTSKEMDIKSFSIYWTLKQNGIQNPESLAARLAAVLRRYPNWKLNAADRRAMTAELYKTMMDAVNKSVMVEVVEKLLKIL